jgi:hypothetical protein
MTRIEACKLCGKQTKLANSHIIPKFTVNWIKKTSATGYIRMAKKPNLRKQDLPKIKLLCKECENRFSKWEKLFAENIFIPYLEKGKQIFEYEDWLIRFAVSLSWRTIMKEIYSFRQESNLATFVDNSLKQWGSFLLEINDNPGTYENHLFFLDYISNINNLHLPDMFQWYLLRGFDSTIAFSEKEVFAYTKLPGFIFCSGISPPKLKGWNKTLIKKEGIIEANQSISQPGFGDFLLNRSSLGVKLKKDLSEKQKEIIIKSLLKNPEKSLRSTGFKTYLIVKNMRKKSNNNY